MDIVRDSEGLGCAGCVDGGGDLGCLVACLGFGRRSTLEWSYEMESG